MELLNCKNRDVGYSRASVLLGPTMKLFHSAIMTILATLCIIVGASANDTTIPCAAPPDKGASVAVHPGSQVSKTQDRQSGTCVFSINGAVATSPPAQQVISAVNFLRDPDRPMLRDSKSLSYSLATIMAASAPVNEVPNDLINLLSNSSERLTACVTKFFSSGGAGDTEPRDPVNSDTVVCFAASAYEDERTKHAILEKGSIAAGLPTLAISATWGNGRFASTVFLPIVTPGQPRLSAQ
ncbi:hypothetical protein [Bradyrhizobium sp. BR 10289]|uniref:hypothetical protein n=1 Tax=Bradyrhizobium sp. BR 10289 TaxID=2749993 RepID=UPI001C6475DA|nr:hypothetical protein [Bradyrhizobium sp. BR 10289]MBW7973553.1 hypothetical protein [Bradyrhizobium sp. BR 10289]